MSDRNVTDEVRSRLQALFNAGQFKQTRIARRLGLNSSTITRYINGPTPLTLVFLEAVADETCVPLAELVAGAEKLHELDAYESALIRALRLWPKSVTQAILSFVGFFADEAPVERQAKNLHEMYRKMDDGDREFLSSLAVLLREKAVPPDLRAGISNQLKGETRLEPKYGKRRATTTTP